MANGFYKDCKNVPKLSIGVASEQHVFVILMFCPSLFTIDRHEFTDLQFRVLPHFKSSDIILGLTALKKMDVVVHPSLNAFTMEDFTIHCNRELSRIFCTIIESGKMIKIIVKIVGSK